MIDFGLGLGAGVLLTIAAIAAVAWWVNAHRELVIGWVMRKALEPKAGRSPAAKISDYSSSGSSKPPDTW